MQYILKQTGTKFSEKDDISQKHKASDTVLIYSSYVDSNAAPKQT